MMVDRIQVQQRREAVVYDAAIEIRRMIDEVREQYNALDSDWDDDDCESRLCDLVFGDDE